MASEDVVKIRHIDDCSDRSYMLAGVYDTIDE